MFKREVVVVAYPGVQGLDVTGPFEVFAGAQQWREHTASRERGYRVRLVAPGGGRIACETGLKFEADGGLEVLREDPIDTLIVAGGAGARIALRDRGLIDALRKAAGRARRVASVCTGAFVLAETGLLDGRRVSTHWAWCNELAASYPALVVERDPIFTRDGDFYTSAGVTAGMDLALAMVEDDIGRDAALMIARHLVLFLRRPGNQSQFSVQLSAQLAQRSSLRDLQQWALEHPDADLSVEALAARAAISPRHFSRSFRAEVGMTPGRYVERIRLEAARRRLEDDREPIALVAAACGFGTAETMRRSFLRALGVSPAEYRRRFESAA